MTRFHRDDDEELIGQIVRAVAWEPGQGLEDLEPMVNSVDTDAITTLFGGDSGNDAHAISFKYEGCEVVIEHDGFTVT